MVAPPYFAPIAINLVGALIAAAVGARLVRMRGSGDVGRAVLRFSAWWFGVSVFIVLGQASALVAAFGVSERAVALVMANLAIVAIVTMMWGLVSYLAFLFTGSPRVFRLVDLFYGAQLALGFVYVAALGPTGYAPAEWGAEPLYANEPPAVANLIFSALFLLPPLIGAVLLGTLAFRAPQRTQRYRAGAVSIGIFVWFGVSLVLNAMVAAGAELTALTAIGGPALGLACMLLIVSAYMPPLWLRSHGVQPFGELNGLVRPDVEARMRALRDRARYLV